MLLKNTIQIVGLSYRKFILEPSGPVIFSIGISSPPFVGSFLPR